MSYMQTQGTLITRDAHEALSVLKKLVDNVEEKIRLAEREAVAVAIGNRKDDDPLRTLRDIAETLQSPNFEAAVSEARAKTKSAVDWHLRFES
jgi:hypothetical protein